VTVTVQIKPGKSLAVMAVGENLGIPLASDPRPVRMEVRHGDRRHCVEFGGRGVHKPNKKLTLRDAAPGGACPQAPASDGAPLD
jgi:hypothetical protein